MLFSRTKKSALNSHRSAVTSYNVAYGRFSTQMESLYNSRKAVITSIDEIEEFINTIAKAPREFEVIIGEIKQELIKFKETEQYAADAYETAKKSGIGMGAGVAAGASVATMAPTAAMWAATTFGTASTGTAISALSGAAATNAALAWLGGGALAAGGGGMVAGQALLALAGPIGWAIAGASTVASVSFAASKNKKVASQLQDETVKIYAAESALTEMIAKIKNLHDETLMLHGKLAGQFESLSYLKHVDYTMLEPHVQRSLGAFVNNTYSMAELINKTVQ